jgi:exodeoxyribonuclease VII small subunit
MLPNKMRLWWDNRGAKFNSPVNQISYYLSYNQHMTKKNTTDFETSIKKLEAIVEKLEEGDLDLDTSLKSFEEGVALVKECQKIISEAELKVNKLLDSGELTSLDD